MAGQPDGPLQVSALLTAIAETWRLFPNQRLGQLLVNAAGREDLFLVPDAVLIEMLRDYRETQFGGGKQWRRS